MSSPLLSALATLALPKAGVGADAVPGTSAGVIVMLPAGRLRLAPGITRLGLLAGRLIFLAGMLILPAAMLILLALLAGTLMLLAGTLILLACIFTVLAGRLTLLTGRVMLLAGTLILLAGRVMLPGRARLLVEFEFGNCTVDLLGDLCLLRWTTGLLGVTGASPVTCLFRRSGDCDIVTCTVGLLARLLGD